jgi:hypothetical protein
MELIDFRRSASSETPWHGMAVLADDARMKGDMRSAIRMIQFVYWAADELVRSTTDRCNTEEESDRHTKTPANLN